MNKLFNFCDYLLNGFAADVETLEKYRDRSTGFFNLDRKFIFAPAMIFVGGLPGMGKSTFCLQLAYQLAKAGEYVVYCSYEMPKSALAAKMIARELFRLCGSNSDVCMSAEKIRAGEYKTDAKIAEKVDYVWYQIVFSACDTLNGICCDMPIEDLVTKLTEAAKSAGDKRFVVVIDYLQLIGVRDKKITSPREKIDYVIYQLKSFQQETGATVIIISAFNRASSAGGLETKLSSFKESGGIEYTGEILWGLQPRGAADMTVENLGDFMKKKPREMELSCVKNRYGACFTCYFDYWSEYDYFDVSTKPVASVKSEKSKVKTEI